MLCGLLWRCTYRMHAGLLISCSLSAMWDDFYMSNFLSCGFLSRLFIFACITSTTVELSVLQCESTEGSLRLFASFLRVWMFKNILKTSMWPFTLDIRVKGAEYLQITVCPLPPGLVWGEIQTRASVTPHTLIFIFQLLPSKKCCRKNETKTIRHTASAYMKPLV